MNPIRWFRAWRFRRKYPNAGKLVVCRSSGLPHPWMPTCAGAYPAKKQR